MVKFFDKKTGATGIMVAILLLAVIVPSMALVSGQQGGNGNGPQDNKTECTSHIESGTFGDIIVPEGETCSLYAFTGDITISGSIKIESEGTLLLFGEHYGYSAIVDGSIQADDAKRVSINGVTVGENVQVNNAQFGVDLSSSSIGGNVQIDSNQKFFSVVKSTIGGNVQVSKNASEETSPLYYNFAGNTIEGNLQCSENNPAPVKYYFGDNTVQGNKQGQCATL